MKNININDIQLVGNFEGKATFLVDGEQISRNVHFNFLKDAYPWVTIYGKKYYEFDFVEMY